MEKILPTYNGLRMLAQQLLQRSDEQSLQSTKSGKKLIRNYTFPLNFPINPPYCKKPQVYIHLFHSDREASRGNVILLG